MELRKGIKVARALRLGATDSERVLWMYLRARRLGGFKFRRQFALSGYVLDFVCLESNLVIELDGGQHAELSESDMHRTHVLQKSGLRVIRFWNDDVLLRIDDVLEEILRQLQAPPSPQPSPASWRGG